MWIYNGKEFSDEQILDNIGFVYIITRISDNKKYIGKKLFTKSKIYQKKKKKKTKRVSSDWSNYYGSNKDLKQDVSLSENPILEFKREILRLCKTRSELNYYETKFIFDNDCLLSDKWYNSWVSCRINGNTLAQINKEYTNV